MAVSRQALEQIRQALNPLEIIREAVPTLKQAGNRWRGLCPFHNERTPSFFFMPEKGLWHCFGSCQEGGDVFKFVMRLENLTFPETLRLLAQKAGVRVEWEKSGGEVSRETRERERLLEVLEEAAAFYRDALRKSAEAEPARRHLAKRRIKPETAETFGLGYAPQGAGFLDAALRKGRAVEDLVKAGLAVRSEKTGRYHDPLRNRLVFPIVDAYGRAVGFGGRTLEEPAPGQTPGPKYLNSPETPVYTKGRQLYGLFQGRSALREKGQALLVEGYMDVVGLHQAGADNAVAPLGTAFTVEQGQLLRRYVQEVILLFDPDEAGVRASWRSAEVLLQADLFVRVGRVPDGRDPDELVLEKGPEALQGVVAQAQDIVDFWLDHIARSSKDFDGLHGRVRQAGELVSFLKGVPNEILKREWLRKIARRLSLDETTLWRQLEKQPAARTAQAAPRGGRPAPAGAPRAVPRPGETPSPAQRGGVRSLEEEILQILCAHPEAWPAAGISASLFQDIRCRWVFEKFQEMRKSRGAVDAAAVAGDLSPEDGGWLSGLLLEEKVFPDPAETLAQRVRELERLASERERRALEGEVLGMLEGRAPRDENKISRYQNLTRALKGAVRT